MWNFQTADEFELLVLWPVPANLGSTGIDAFLEHNIAASLRAISRFQLTIARKTKSSRMFLLHFLVCDLLDVLSSDSDSLAVSICEP